MLLPEARGRQVLEPVRPEVVKGSAPGYSRPKLGDIQKTTKMEDRPFRDIQGVFALNPAAERMDLYGKPGTSASARQPDPYAVSYPISRYRSSRP